MALAAVAIAVSMLTLIGIDQREPLDAPAWSLAVAHAAPIAVRRRWPLPAFVVSGVAALVFIASGYPMVGLGVSALLMVFTLAAEESPAVSLPGVAVAGAGMVAALEVAGSPMGGGTVVGNLAVLGVAWLVGDSARRRRRHAETEQVALARQAVAEERMRIARELHDVVAHSMSVVGVQAGLARVSLEDDPAQARSALAAIEGASRQAMNELRRLLHVLRDESEQATELSPAPGLAELPALVTHSSLGGTPVAILERGDRRKLTTGLDLTAYRVVQEALTNVRRHAPGATARLTFTYEDDGLVIQVDNEMPDGATIAGGGHGLTGMRERVELYRGELQTGLGPDGSFRVVARLPYQESGT